MSPILIMFAIRATLKLGEASKKAYIDSTRDRTLILPPPKTFGSNHYNALKFFKIHSKRFLDESSDWAHPKAKRINQLLLTANPNDYTTEERAELIEYHKMGRSILDLEQGLGPWGLGKWGEPVNLDSDECRGLLAIGTWTYDGKENTKWWQNMAETLFDLGLEYAMGDPNICNPETTTGQALKTFLASLEKIEFTETELQDFPSMLLITALDVASTHPNLITGGERGQKILSATTKALSEEIVKQLADCEDIHRPAVKEWGSTIFRTILTSAGRIVVDDPGTYLGINGEKSEEMAAAVGGAVYELVFIQETNDINFKKLFDGPGLEAVTQAALTVVSKHPDILLNTSNKGLNELVSSMAEDLAKTDTLFAKEAMPEILRLLLDNTADNIELIWPDPKDVSSHLLTKAASRTLKVLADNSTGQWKLEFTHSDAVEVIGCVFDELKANPAWLTGDARDFDTALNVILDETLSVIRTKGDPKMTRNAAKNILFTTMTTALTRVEFMEKHPYGYAAKPFITACLDVILTEVIKPDEYTNEELFKIKCQLTRDAGLDMLLSFVFGILEQTDLGTEAEKEAFLVNLKQGLKKLVQDIKDGKAIDLSKLEDNLIPATPAT